MIILNIRQHNQPIRIPTNLLDVPISKTIEFLSGLSDNLKQPNIKDYPLDEIDVEMGLTESPDYTQKLTVWQMQVLQLFTGVDAHIWGNASIASEEPDLNGISAFYFAWLQIAPILGQMIGFHNSEVANAPLDHYTWNGQKYYVRKDTNELITAHYVIAHSYMTRAFKKTNSGDLRGFYGLLAVFLQTEAEYKSKESSPLSEQELIQRAKMFEQFPTEYAFEVAFFLNKKLQKLNETIQILSAHQQAAQLHKPKRN